MRRVVVCTADDGCSMISSDGLPGILFHFKDEADPHTVAAERITAVPAELGPGQGVLGELWTSSLIDATDGDPGASGGGWNPEVAPGHTRFRTSRFAPGRQTTMHRTSTLDYDVVLEGSITLKVSSGQEVELHQGDAVIIRAASHAWRAGPDGARIGVVMIGLPRVCP